jgi:hypothetical protein
MLIGSAGHVLGFRARRAARSRPWPTEHKLHAGAVAAAFFVTIYLLDLFLRVLSFTRFFSVLIFFSLKAFASSFLEQNMKQTSAFFRVVHALHALSVVNITGKRSHGSTRSDHGAPPRVLPTQKGGHGHGERLGQRIGWQQKQEWWQVKQKLEAEISSPQTGILSPQIQKIVLW